MTATLRDAMNRLQARHVMFGLTGSASPFATKHWFAPTESRLLNTHAFADTHWMTEGSA